MPSPETTRRLGRAGIAFVVVISAGVWFYALVLSDAKPTDTLSDKTFAPAAEPICKAMTNQLKADGLVDQVAATPQSRAELAAKADAVVSAMVDQLATHVPSAGADARILTAWIGDWHAWLQDRATWESMLRSGKDGPFNERQRQTGEPNSQALDKLANTNDMPSCTIPSGV